MQPANKNIDPIDFYLMSAMGDLADIFSKFKPPKFDSMTVKQLKKYILFNTHWSILFKVKEDFSHIFLAITPNIYMQ